MGILSRNNYQKFVQKALTFCVNELKYKCEQRKQIAHEQIPKID